MPRPTPSYPTVPLLPGEVASLIELVNDRYLTVQIYTTSENAPGFTGGIGANVKVSNPTNCTRPAQYHSRTIWGHGQYKSYEAALYGALWKLLDETYIPGDWDGME